jgi:integrase
MDSQNFQSRRDWMQRRQQRRAVVAATKAVVEHKGKAGRGGHFRSYLLNYQRDARTVDRAELYGKMPGTRKIQRAGWEPCIPELFTATYRLPLTRFSVPLIPLPYTAEVRAMIAAMPETLQGVRATALLLVGFAGGFRRSELAALTMEHVAGNDGRVDVPRRLASATSGSEARAIAAFT